MLRRVHGPALARLDRDILNRPFGLRRSVHDDVHVDARLRSALVVHRHGQLVEAARLQRGRRRDLRGQGVDRELVVVIGQFVVRNAGRGLGGHNADHIPGSDRLFQPEHPRIWGRKPDAALDERGLRIRIDLEGVRPVTRRVEGQAQRHVEDLDSLRVVVLQRLYADRLRCLARLEGDDLVRCRVVPAGQCRPIGRPPAHRDPVRHGRRHGHGRPPSPAFADRVRRRRERDRNRSVVRDGRRRRRLVHEQRAGTGRPGQRQHHRLALVEDAVLKRFERDPRGAFALRDRRLTGQRRVVLAGHSRAGDRVFDRDGSGGGAARHRHLEVAGLSFGHRAATGRGESHPEGVGRRRSTGESMRIDRQDGRQQGSTCRHQEDPGEPGKHGRGLRTRPGTTPWGSGAGEM